VKGVSFLRALPSVLVTRAGPLGKRGHEKLVSINWGRPNHLLFYWTKRRSHEKEKRLEKGGGHREDNHFLEEAVYFCFRNWFRRGKDNCTGKKKGGGGFPMRNAFGRKGGGRFTSEKAFS